MNWDAVKWLERKFELTWQRSGYRVEQYSFEFGMDVIRYGVMTGKSCGPFMSIKEDDASTFYYQEPFPWEEIEAICGRRA
jgi:hypothetical protein